VFDALDRDGDGFVRMEDFIQFATAYGAEQVGSELVRVE
jgi:Rab11 family-interacting protein 3/4